MTYAKQNGEKDFADKVQTQKHWNMNDLTKQPNYRKDFKPISRWSEEHKSYATDDEKRLFERIITGGYDKVQAEKVRE